MIGGGQVPYERKGLSIIETIIETPRIIFREKLLLLMLLMLMMLLMLLMLLMMLMLLLLLGVVSSHQHEILP